MQLSKKQIGNNGEDRAAAFYESLGYTVVARNFRTQTGEIDVILEKDDLLVFSEVKTLPNGTPELMAKVLDIGKQKRIIKTAKRFLLNHRQYSNSYIRFDVIVLDMPGFPDVYHIENAFSELL
ncbi:MAG: YraN family protein [Treponema sp.]|nr:YraN family protein [Treponema sp.]